MKVKLQILRLLATMRLDRAKMDLIAGFMDTYLALTAKEELALQRELVNLADDEERVSVMELITNYERKGRQAGRVEGRQAGRLEGRHDGELAVIKRLLKLRLGAISPQLERNLNRLSIARLEELAEALLGFESLADLHRWLARKSKNGAPG